MPTITAIGAVSGARIEGIIRTIARRCAAAVKTDWIFTLRPKRQPSQGKA
jgi:hypothetical protein